MTSREQRDAQWADLWARAEKAGDDAIAPLQGREWRVWARSGVTIRPATTSFARYLRRQGVGGPATQGGWCVAHMLGDELACHLYINAISDVLEGAGFQVTTMWELD